MFYYACLLLIFSANNLYKKKGVDVIHPYSLTWGPMKNKACMRPVNNFSVLVQTKQLTFTNYEHLHLKVWAFDKHILENHQHFFQWHWKEVLFSLMIVCGFNLWHYHIWLVIMHDMFYDSISDQYICKRLKQVLSLFAFINMHFQNISHQYWDFEDFICLY